MNVPMFNLEVVSLRTGRYSTAKYALCEYTKSHILSFGIERIYR